MRHVSTELAIGTFLIWHLTYSTTTMTIPELEQLNGHHARYTIGVTQLVMEALFM